MINQYGILYYMDTRKTLPRAVLSRMYFIDRQIASGKYPNVNDLAREYEVGTATIYRDIEYMRNMLDAPIEYSAKDRGWFYTVFLPHFCYLHKLLYRLNEIRNRGTEDILIVCMDGLTGFPDAVRAVFPETRIQKCIVHMVRNSTKFVSYKDLKAVCADLKAIYRAPSEEAGRAALEQFGEKWQTKYPLIYKSWDSNWPDMCEFFKYPEAIRRVIYTTNAIESLNYQLRKATRNRSVLAGDEAIYKIMYLALSNAAKKWIMPIKDWGAALNQFALFFGERVPLL